MKPTAVCALGSPSSAARYRPTQAQDQSPRKRLPPLASPWSPSCTDRSTIPEKAWPELDPGWIPVRKRSCSNDKPDDDSNKRHRAVPDCPSSPRFAADFGFAALGHYRKRDAGRQASSPPPPTGG